MARFLLLCAPFGSGHRRAAEAIAEALYSQDETNECKITDLFTYLPRPLLDVILGGYRQMLRYAPGVYRMLYHRGDRVGGASLVEHITEPIFREKLWREVEAYQPDAVCCSHATPTGVMGKLAVSGRIAVPITAVVTDYTAHRLWMRDGITEYFVAHEELKDRFFYSGYCGGRVTVSGMPVSRAFRRGKERGREILVMGGGFGLMETLPILRALMRAGLDCPVRIIAGSEEKREELLRQTAKIRSSVILEGHSTKVYEAMRKAKLLITKPGAMTAAEAMVTGVPLLFFAPLPGQEEINAAFLTEKRAAFLARNEDELTELIGILDNDTDGWRGRMLSAQRAIAREEAADIIARHLMVLAGQKKG